MYTFIKEAHSGIAYLLLLPLVLIVLFAAYSFFTKQAFTDRHKKFALVGLIVTHLQILLGLIIYFISPLGMSNFSGESMKSSTMRLYILEHPLMMIIAAVLITIGYSRAKRLIVDSSRHKAILIFYGIALIFILSRIPWSVWP
ncbi:MAG: hypothetical protein IPH96_15940 [Saprospiraceae bacterium]|nr:hypothetical protein [Saprospiraceae bacterium]